MEPRKSGSKLLLPPFQSFCALFADNSYEVNHAGCESEDITRPKNKTHPTRYKVTTANH